MSVGVECGFSSEEVLCERFPVHRACRDGDTAALSALLQRLPEQILLEDSFYGWTPIHWAAHFGTLECVMQLVQVGCGVNSVTSRFAQTPAHIAAFGGHPHCLLWLLQAGADINRQDYVGETPIHKAARAGSIECINTLLMQGAKADLRNASGLTAADLAHAQGFQECAQQLSNAQNQQRNQHNGFSTINSKGVLNRGHQLSQGRSFLNGVASRKRSLDCLETSHFKKARTRDLEVQMNMNGMNGSVGEDLMDTMQMEFGPAPCSTGNSITVSHPETENGKMAFTAGAGVLGFSLHFDPLDNGLHFSHHNGFGDTAENIEDASSQIEHRKSISVEEQYDHAFFSTVHLFHGS
ncbi:ankyrin repeat domain-containing protein 10b isoform X2 [Hoplias malabaricus]|uniref:ankyrin repeat domain-containing protein 10b isoform X2 n=1 Tax=Hoplias malabaricus TaxID=27720 RepID=UPI00346330AB